MIHSNSRSTGSLRMMHYRHLILDVLRAVEVTQTSWNRGRLA